MIYTMGFTQKSAEEFFEKIKQHEIELLIDVRLNNKSQLAGFTKGQDLSYFLNVICNCQYVHELQFAPTKVILDAYKKAKSDWAVYETSFNKLLLEREVENCFEKKYMTFNKVLLLCSEPTPEHCHRRLLAEYLQRKLHVDVIHI